MFANIVIVIALLTVLGTLVLGMLNMRKTGEAARLKSNQLMRIRVGAQAIAVGALMLMLYLKSQGTA
ncbi:MAG: twin transmembrane helix small protein [Hyphomonadaceae bacterium]|nr:twin transmembrane helix small protein [Hyphomonadaceae bacterium]